MLHSIYDLRLENLPAEIWEKITQIDELKGRWVGGVRLGPQVLGRLKQSVLITSTGASTRIEGARLSDADVEKLMRGISVQKFSDRDQQEVMGYLELLTNVFDSWGRLRFSDSLVQFLQIHPFQDGNGRMSRILTNLLMLKAGYTYIPYVSHEKIVEDNKPEYYLALRQSQRTFPTDQETIRPWLTFFLDIVWMQARMALDLLSEENIEKLLSPRQVDVWRYMQAARQVTPKQLSDELGIPRPTINQVLNRLIELNKIERIGLGRGTRYRVKLG